MKLKILPPTLRINNRYLVLDIKSESKITKDELVSAIWDGCIRFSGELETSNFNLWIMRFYDFTDKITDFSLEYNQDFYYYKAVLRCQRNFEEEVRGSIAAMYNYKGNKIAINTVGKSGTIKSAITKFIY
ncbi:Rpp14/Pop5 family protein [Methanobrevibacter cuticularis]|nr:Rpp14/Pop5 family protein [Methanobrevibacter cuticularis]